MSNIVKFRSFPATKFFTNSLLDDVFNRSIGDFIGSDALVYQPAVNVAETGTSFNVEVAAPGFEKQNFTVKVEQGILTISAQREEKQDETDTRYTRREFRFESFQRSFKLPELVNQDAVTAVYENGVLLVKLPKKEEAKAVAKTISIG